MKFAPSLLACALLGSPLTLAQEAAALDLVEAPGLPHSSQESVRDAIVSISTMQSEPTTLREFFALATKRIHPVPSIAFKASTAEIEVPKMELQQVRFGDLIDALELLIDVRFSLMNPNPKVGQSSLLTVEPNNRNGAQRVKANPGGAGGGIARVPPSPLVSPNAPATAIRPTPVIDGTPSLQAIPTPNPLAIDIHPQVIPPATIRDLAASWNTTPAQPAAKKLLTSSYAIGALISEEKSGQSAAQVIEAINLAWSTADENNKDSRIALHEPSSLLIIKAPLDFQSLAREVIENLKVAQSERQQASKELDRSDRLQEEFIRERNHINELHQETVARLKESQKSDSEKHRELVAVLEAELREAKNDHVQLKDHINDQASAHAKEIDRWHQSMAELNSQLEALKTKKAKGGE